MYLINHLKFISQSYNETKSNLSQYCFCPILCYVRLHFFVPENLRNKSKLYGLNEIFMCQITMDVFIVSVITNSATICASSGCEFPERTSMGHFCPGIDIIAIFALRPSPFSYNKYWLLQKLLSQSFRGECKFGKGGTFWLSHLNE